ncbi:MAG TPA: glycosyltransferase [Frankiaceae bacterium]|nr:glycosyltransferase [Frankiaceae bacterium]
MTVRVLVVHNRYVSAVPSGENAVVDDEIGALRGAGVEVLTHLRSSDEIAALPPARKAALAVRPVRSGEDADAVEALIRRQRPDVLHLHNPYPLVSPWVVRVAARAGVPVVQTLHNYRHACIAGSLFRDGHACEDCIGTPLRWPGVVHGCYRGSRPQSVVLTAAEVLHGPTWRKVDRFLALTSFAARTLSRAGVPLDRVTIRPTSAPDPGGPEPPGTGHLFVGRLDEEKGALLLAEAWRRTPRGGRLTIVGDGRCRPEIERLAAERDDVCYLGAQPSGRVAREMAHAAAVVIPSVCYEGLPRVLVEAFARARPVLATDVGPLPELVTDDVGWTAPATPDAFAAALAATRPPDPVRGAAARARYLGEHTPERSLRTLLDVYESVRR